MAALIGDGLKTWPSGRLQAGGQRCVIREWGRIGRLGLVVTHVVPQRGTGAGRVREEALRQRGVTVVDEYSVHRSCRQSTFARSALGTVPCFLKAASNRVLSHVSPWGDSFTAACWL